jgi:DNA invertase Pin-like site-specific DNA recombinase
MAYSYVRFSTPEQAKGDSFARQIGLARNYAERHGLTLDETLTFHDLGVSAFRGRNAETGRLGEFLEAVQGGLVPSGSFLLVESLDRISRQAARKAFTVLGGICDAGITVVTLADGHTYTMESLDSDPQALLMSLLIFIRANEESAMKSRRLKASWDSKRSRAAQRPLTARTPAWLRLNKQTEQFELIEERAAIVRRIFEMAARGVGQHKIAETLNRENVPLFGRGKHWHRSYVIKILANPAAIGTMIPHEITYETGKKQRKPVSGGAVEGYFPAVVDPETFHRVNGLARNPARGKHAATGVVNVLGGVAKCSECGASMVLVSKGNGNRYLVCSIAKVGGTVDGKQCEYRAVRYEAVEGSLIAQAGAIVCPHLDDGNPFLMPHPLEALCSDLHAAIEHYSEELYRS